MDVPEHQALKEPMQIKACLFQTNRNKHLAYALVRRARSQGYDIEAFQDESIQGKIKYPHVTNHAFYHTCREMKDFRFVWLEPDCSILDDKWLDKLDTLCLGLSTDDILAPRRSACPHDVASGICVYPKNYIDALPELSVFEDKWYAFDHWMEQNLVKHIKRTNLIQHSYGIYDADGFATYHRFPRDKWILDKNAVVFHSDKCQDLMTLTDPESDQYDIDMSFELPMPVA